MGCKPGASNYLKVYLFSMAKKITRKSRMIELSEFTIDVLSSVGIPNRHNTLVRQMFKILIVSKRNRTVLGFRNQLKEFGSVHIQRVLSILSHTPDLFPYAILRDWRGPTWLLSHQELHMIFQRSMALSHALYAISKTQWFITIATWKSKNQWVFVFFCTYNNAKRF